MIQWQIALQIAPGPEPRRRPTCHQTSAYVNITQSDTRSFLTHRTREGVRPSSTFNWTISESGKIVTTPGSEQPNVDLHEDVHGSAHSRAASGGTTGPVIVNNTIVVKDILIVSIGDSYASGEGNPVVPGYFGFESAQWAYSPDPAMERENANAHRSTAAAPAQFALALQKSNPHEAVTFVSVADSGASIAQGLLGPMPSIGARVYAPGREIERGAAKSSARTRSTS